MSNLFNKLNEGGIGAKETICVEGVTLCVERVRWGYRIQVIEITSRHFYLYEGLKTVLSEGFVETLHEGDYSFRNLHNYYLGYEPSMPVRDLELCNLLLEGVCHND